MSDSGRQNRTGFELCAEKVLESAWDKSGDDPGHADIVEAIANGLDAAYQNGLAARQHEVDDLKHEVERLKATLQQVMQVMGPGIPHFVDYTDGDNLAGLTYEFEEALRILREAGIEYRSRKERRE